MEGFYLFSWRKVKENELNYYVIFMLFILFMASNLRNIQFVDLILIFLHTFQCFSIFNVMIFIFSKIILIGDEYMINSTNKTSI